MVAMMIAAKVSEYQVENRKHQWDRSNVVVIYQTLQNPTALVPVLSWVQHTITVVALQQCCSAFPNTRARSPRACFSLHAPKNATFPPR